MGAAEKRGKSKRQFTPGFAELMGLSRIPENKETNYDEQERTIFSLSHDVELLLEELELKQESIEEVEDETKTQQET